jgi:hypothetical protein
MLRGLLPLSRSRLRGKRREGKGKGKVKVEVKAKIKARGWRVEAKAQVKVEVKSSASESHDEACSLSKGTPLLQQITLRDSGVLQKPENLSNARVDSGSKYAIHP